MTACDDLLEQMRSWLAEDNDQVRRMSAREFAGTSLRGAGVDSLSLVELVVRVGVRTGRHVGDAFLASPDIDVPVNWCRELGVTVQEEVQGDEQERGGAR